MTYLVIGFAACAVAALTLFSGFGLGTLLMPAFALFFPVAVAVAATAVVHVLNNLFKLALLRRHVAGRLVLAFGLPATLAAIPGAWLLTKLSDTKPWFTWHGWGEHAITPVRAVMGLLILAFAAFELAPGLARWRVSPRWLWAGGLLSGFFGGLSGHQGALRAVFLGSQQLSPPAFAGTQAAIACLVDGARLAVYGVALFGAHAAGIAAVSQWPLVAVATLCAFVGSYFGAQLVHKVTVAFVRRVTGALLVVVGAALASGLI
jgi:uncharacterized membrane protein YfcA